MQNLREQLLKAGLISEADKKKVETEKPREPSRPAPSRPPAREARPPGGSTGGGRPQPAGRPHGAGAGGRPHAGGRPQRDAPIPKLPPLADPNNKEFQRLEAKKQLEVNRQIRELVLATQVPVEAGDHTFFFVTRKNRLRRMEMTPTQAQLLETGKLAVVERPEPAQIEHSLVPPETAEKLLALNEKTVRFFNRTGAPVGFLSDEEIARRQKVEADRGAEGEAAEAGTEVAATAPDDAAAAGEETGPAADAGTAAEAKSPSEALAENAERAAPASTEESQG